MKKLLGAVMIVSSLAITVTNLIWLFTARPVHISLAGIAGVLAVGGIITYFNPTTSSKDPD